MSHIRTDFVCISSRLAEDVEVFAQNWLAAETDLADGEFCK